MNSLSNTAIPDELVTPVQVLTDDEGLRKWFASLGVMPANRRYSELGRFAMRFKDAGQENLGRVILSLNDERVYRRVREVLNATRN